MNSNFVSEIDTILKEKSLLNHPFYKMWSQGTLDLKALKGYAKEYYSLEAAFPDLLLKARMHRHSETDDEVLMDNYAEETAKGKSHADMWLNFAVGLGLERNQVKTHTPLNSTKKALGEIESLVEKDYLLGIGALLSYEANLQETSATKMEGLEKYYGLKDKKSIEFFAVHGILDIKHSNDWREVLSENAITEKRQMQVKEAIGKSMDALWSFLDGINERYNGARAC